MQHAASLVPAACLLLLAACAVERRDALPADPGTAILTGSIGPGAPPDGEVPDRLDLVFTRDGQTVRAKAVDGRYEVTLRAGTWDVRTTDGRACATGITLSGGSRQRQDLIYPGECFDARPPDGPPAPSY